MTGFLDGAPMLAGTPRTAGENYKYGYKTGAWGGTSSAVAAEGWEATLNFASCG